jgi:large subunit ribosomal protein L25
MAAKATQAILAAERRTERGKSAARKLRVAGRIPAVLYGHGEETQSLSLDAHELELLFAHISVESTLITLKIEGVKGGEVRALVREVQKHPVKAKPMHVDFYQIHAGEKVMVHVPIRIHGTPAGVRAGGLLNQALDTLDVLSLPENIPGVIEVDVSKLEIGDSIHVRDLALPEGVETDIDGDITVCAVAHPAGGAAVEPTEAVEGAAPAEPEVIRRRADKDEE